MFSLTFYGVNGHVWVEHLLTGLPGGPLGFLIVVNLLTFVLAFALSSLGVAIASRMRSMQGFQVVMNFLMMPIFFLSGALFPLQGLPDWMTVLTRIDPAAYGMDPLRRVALGDQLPHGVLNQMGIGLFGIDPLPILAEVAILLAFGVVMLVIAILNFRVRD